MELAKNMFGDLDAGRGQRVSGATWLGEGKVPLQVRNMGKWKHQLMLVQLVV